MQFEHCLTSALNKVFLTADSARVDFELRGDLFIIKYTTSPSYTDHLRYLMKSFGAENFSSVVYSDKSEIKITFNIATILPTDLVFNLNPFKLNIDSSSGFLKYKVQFDILSKAFDESRLYKKDTAIIPNRRFTENPCSTFEKNFTND